MFGTAKVLCNNTPLTAGDTGGLRTVESGAEIAAGPVVSVSVGPSRRSDPVSTVWCTEYCVLGRMPAR